MNKNIKPLVLKIHQCAQKNEDLKWVMNTEGKIPIMVSRYPSESFGQSETISCGKIHIIRQEISPKN